MKKAKYILFVLLLILLWSGCDSRHINDQDQETTTAHNHPIKNLPIPALGKPVDPDSLAQPKTVPLLRKPKVVPARKNIFLAEAPTVLPVSDNITIITPGENGVPLPDTITMLQEVVPVIHPRPTIAGAPAMKPEAITDIQYLSVSQGLRDPWVNAIIEDRRGYLWFANREYLSRYDGQRFIHYAPIFGAYDIESIMEDNKGKLWLGSNVGLNCYDGKFHTQYSIEEGGNGFSVLSMMEDHQGKLWFGTYSGLYAYDPSANSARARFVKYTTREGLNDHRVYSMVEDQEGGLWFGTELGLSRYDGKQITNYVIEACLTNEDNSVRSMIEDSKGILWLGTGLGLIRFDPSANAGQGSFANINIKVDRIRALTEDRKGNIWVAGYTDGLLCLLRDETGIGTRYVRYTQKEGLNATYLRSILEDSHGNIWIGGQTGGVSRINIKNPVRYYNQESGLKGKNLSGIFEDKRGSLWFGVELGGVIRYDTANGGVFKSYGTEEGLYLNDVTSFMEDPHGNLWMGSWGGSSGDGASRFNLSKDYGPPKLSYSGKESFTYFNVETGLHGKSVLSMLQDSRGKLWFGNDQNMTYYDPDYLSNGVGRFFHYPLEGKFRLSTVSDLLEDRKGNVWLSTWGGGVYKLDLNLSKNRLDSTKLVAAKAQHWTEGQSYIKYTTKDGLADDDVKDMLEDSQGMLWFMTKKGLSRLDPMEERFYTYNAKDGLLNGRLYFMTEDQQHRHWILSQSGINVMVREPDSTSTLASPERKDYHLFSLYAADGFMTADYGLKTILVTRQNQLWWATGNGVASLDLNKFELPANTPKINLNSIEIEQTNLDFPSLKNANSGKRSNLEEQVAESFDSVAAFNNYPLNLALPYHLNHLSFQYAAIDWNAPHQLQYSYLMEGMDKNWSELSSETKADYRNLAPGNYTFKVKAIGAAKKWSEVLEYPFKIRPPWWQSWWAYVSYFLLVVIAIRLYIRWRTQKLEKEKIQLEEKVSQRTLELNESLENLKSTQAQLIQSEKMASLGELTAGIAHEIQNPLNFVNNFSQVSNELLEEIAEELEEGNTEEVREILTMLSQNLEKINHHGERASGIVKGMLQHSRSNKGEKEPTDINALCDEYLRLAYHGIRAKDNSFNVKMETSFDESIKIINVIPQDIGKVLLNLINNAFYACAERLALSQAEGSQSTTSEKSKMTNNTYSPTVTISTYKKGNTLEISVKDNGNGIPEPIKEKIFQPFFTTKPTGKGTGLGLSLAFDIIKAHQGELTVDSEEGVGTTFMITLPNT